jgi:zinc/manganese transport system substrate-binding protein
MKKLLISFLLVLVLATPAAAKLNVVATLPWIGSLASDLGKDKVNVKVLVKPNQDPHQIEAKPSMILAARTADILMYNGLDLEIGFLPILIESSRNNRIQPGKSGNLDCSQFINAIEKQEAVDRSMGDVHPLGNPHYHLSARNIIQVVRGMTQVMAKSDPENATFYRANLASFESRLQKKQNQWSKIPLRGKKYIAYHKFFEYLARDYGFQIIDYIEEKPGIPPSARHIGKLIASAKQAGAYGILTTGYYGKKEVNALAQKTGLRSIVVPHDVGSAVGINDWFSLMDAVLKSLE